MTEPGWVEGFDVIGDVHGQCDALERLLGSMGYRQVRGAWRHDARQAIFVGDLIDRGPSQIDTVELVRRMVDAGSARMVVGNHEYNAVAWTLEDPDKPGTMIRCHSKHHGRQHRAFLEQVEEGSRRHHEYIDWFATLPMWTQVELGGASLRVVHACWHDPAMDVLRDLAGTEGIMSKDTVIATRKSVKPHYDALEVVLKGPEVDIRPHSYVDKDGKKRVAARTRWWDDGAATLDRLVLLPPDARTVDGERLPNLPAETKANKHRYLDAVPVVFGHYWFHEPFETCGAHAACVDYSAGAGAGTFLAAYRWNGETRLDTANYLGVPTVA